MTWLEGLMLVVVGFLSGSLNVIAGGGSLISLPVLIFLGIPSSIANATNRLGLFFQNVFSVRGFISKGVSVFPYSYWAAISASIGSIIGSLFAVEIADKAFNKILAIVMIIVMLAIAFKPAFKATSVGTFTRKKNIVSVLLFFFIGIYGGFLHAGIGFIKIAVLTLVHHLPIARANSIKVFVALCYTSVAIVVFILNDMIFWKYGLTLALGTALGGWTASRWSVGVPDKYIRIFLLIVISVLALKLCVFLIG